MTEPKAHSLPWQLEEVPCDFCGAPDADVLYSGRDRLHGLPGEFRVVVCRTCGLARTSPRLTPESLGAAYPEDYGPHQGGRAGPMPPGGLLRWALVNLRGYPLGSASSRSARGLLWLPGACVLRRRRSLRYLPFTGQGRLLDFGCGAGRYVAQMAAAGWQAEGLDLSPAAVQAGRNAGLVIHQGTLPGANLPDAAYDAITMWHALEHVPAPKATLAAAHALLRPGGRLLVAVPRLDSLAARWLGSAWYGLDLPRHLTHFTARTLRRHLESTGFRVESCRGVRRPGFLRHGYAALARETGRAAHRWLSRSRLVTGLLSNVALLVGRTQQIVCVARRG